MAWAYIRELLQTKKKDTPSEKKDSARPFADPPPADQEDMTGALTPETVAAIALAIQLIGADQAEAAGGLAPEAVAAIALAVHMHFLSIRPAPSATVQIVSDAWTQSGRIMAMTGRLNVFNR